MAKRGSNIYKRKDGRFEGRIPMGYRENGSVRYKSVYARTLGEVKEKMAQFYSVKQNTVSSVLKLTVREAAEQWLYSAKLRVKASSYLNYESIVRRHIIALLGNEKFSLLTAQKLNDFIHFKLKHGRISGKGGLSAKSVRDIMTVYRSIEAFAVKEYGIRPIRFTMPKTEQKQLSVLDYFERKRLEQYLLCSVTNSNLAVLLCLFTGLRIGELCALQWGDIDFRSGLLSVTKTVQRITRNKKSQLVMGSPKSKT